MHTSTPASGGNRARSWAIDVQMPDGAITEHPEIQAILTDRTPGITKFRRSKDSPTKQTIAAEVMTDLTRLHAHPAADIVLDGGGDGLRIADHVAVELTI